MNYLKKFLKKVRKVFKLICEYPEKAKREAVELGLVDFSGQGRDKYGR